MTVPSWRTASRRGACAVGGARDLFQLGAPLHQGVPIGAVEIPPQSGKQLDQRDRSALDDLTGLPADHIGVAEHAPLLHHQLGVVGSGYEQRRKLLGTQRPILGGTDGKRDLVIGAGAPGVADAAAGEGVRGEVRAEPGEHHVGGADEGVVLATGDLAEKRVPAVRGNFVDRGREPQLASLLGGDVGDREDVTVSGELGTHRLPQRLDSLGRDDRAVFAQHPADRRDHGLPGTALRTYLTGPIVHYGVVGQRLQERGAGRLGERGKDVQRSPDGGPLDLQPVQRGARGVTVQLAQVRGMDGLPVGVEPGCSLLGLHSPGGAFEQADLCEEGDVVGVEGHVDGDARVTSGVDHRAWNHAVLDRSEPSVGGPYAQR